jgi:hypothetical protein
VPVRLHLESLDDEPEDREFPDLSSATDYAVRWFLDGYENDTIDDHGREMAREYAKRLADDLTNGREFTCNLFYERVSVANT